PPRVESASSSGASADSARRSGWSRSRRTSRGPERARCSPRSRRGLPGARVFPPVGILGPRMSFAELSMAQALVHRIRGGGPAGLHDEVRKGQVPLPPVECVREFLPAAILHPSADRRVSEEQFDLSKILERDRGRVDAEELDLEAVLLQQIAHRILVEGPSRAAARLFP